MADFDVPAERSQQGRLLVGSLSSIALYSESRVTQACHAPLLREIQRILRKTFWEAVKHEPFTYHPSAHMEHCFDTLRQVRSKWCVVAYGEAC